MALSAVTTTISKTFMHDALFNVLGTIAIGASPGTYPTGGFTLALNDPLIKSSRLPIWVDIKGVNGFVYVYVPGTTTANGKLKILTGAAAQSALTELSAGATPAGVSGDTIQIWARFLGML